MKKNILPIGLFSLFTTIALVTWLSSGTIFYLFNFMYIGTLLSLAFFLFNVGKSYARRVAQLGIGLYMLVFLGIFGRENMQLSGFFYYLHLGVFQAAVLHYCVAKIGGPLLFSRGWCGYACWTAMVLDFLPYKTPQSHERKKKLGNLRYAVFAATLLAFVAAARAFDAARLERAMFVAFIAGNAVYYIVGIFMAYRFRDNRAFCKYFCPITVFLKPMSYFARMRVRKDEAKCVGCRKCLKVCPMDVDMLDSRRCRANGTECIVCGECVKVCPKGALKM